MELNNLIGVPAGHIALFGTTGSGKSTLQDALIMATIAKHRDARILVIDTKKRYHCDWELNGLSAVRRYKHMRTVGKLADAVRIPLGVPYATIKRAWNTLPGRIIVAQSDNENEYPLLNYYVEQFYKHTTKSYWHLAVIDEALALSRIRGNGAGMRTIATCGRERGCFLSISSQRPRWIPIEVMSEMSKCHLFAIDYAEDIDRLRDMGMQMSKQPRPPQADIEILQQAGRWVDNYMPDHDYSFISWDKKSRQFAHLRLTV